jgi:hypothetical protein
MAPTPAVLNAPIEFTDDNGAQVQIPSSVLSFDDGKAKVDAAWPKYAPNAKVIDALLEILVEDGLIRPAPVPPADEALVVIAKDPGIFGNEIEVEFSDVHKDPADPTKTRLDATVTERNTFTGLSPNGPEPKLKSILGTSVNGGVGRTLAFVKGATPPALPKNGQYAFAGSGAGGNTAPFEADVPDTATPAGTAFKLEAKRADPGAKATTVTITNSTPGTGGAGGSFDLELVWTKTVTDVEPADLDAAFDYEVDVTPPPGKPLKAPAPGTLGLSGGANAAAAKAATATAVTPR